MSKLYLKFKGVYIGKDKPNIKKGDSIFIIFDKKSIKADYMYDAFCRDGQGAKKISLLTYVRQRVNTICLIGSIYNW